MSRRVSAGLALVLALTGTLLLWWVFRGPSTAPPAQQSIEGLAQAVSVGWTDHHTTVLDASRSADALSALGYAHGMQRPWTVTVWRRTALGTLAATFGEGVLPIDRHARRLGLAHHARRTYEQLPAPTRRRLQAYTRGLNAALQSAEVSRRTPFAALPIAPQRWEPWHPLAIERLWAWVSTDPSVFDTRDSTALQAADRRFRRWLHLHGQARSIAWAAQAPADTAGTVLFARHVLGRTADPVLQELELRRPGASPVLVASIPGTLLFPTGTTGTRAWAYLLDSPARVTQASVDSSAIHRRHERIATASGDEHLLTVRQVDAGLLLPGTTADSTRLLRWPGLRAHTDVARWIDLATLRVDSASVPAPTQFHLFGGNGLTVDAQGTWTVHGQPPVVEERNGTVLIGHPPWSQYQADVLDAQRRTGPLSPAHWSQHDSSAWAGAVLPNALPDLAPPSDTAPVLDDALSYLRNWDHVYERASIGAVVFEQWMQTYQSAIGRRLSATNPAYFAGPRRRRALRRAVDTLTQRYGRDVRRWRWERMAPGRRSFPVWSADSLVSVDLSPFATTRYAPLDRPGRGHASTLAGGPSRVAPLPLGAAPTHWDGWIRSGRPTLTVRRLRVDPSAFFSRSLLPQSPPTSVSVPDVPITRTTNLVPARTGD